MENKNDILQAKIEQLVSENQTLRKELDALKNIIDSVEAAKVVHYNRELEQFTYVATHDLKTPLANITGYLDLLEMDLEDPSDDVKDSMKWLKYSVQEAMNVIKELTSALKARNDKDELLHEIDLYDLVESILSGMRSSILEKKIVFVCDFTEVDRFHYYPVALRSILQNIISNATEYIDPNKNPEIKVTTRFLDDFICIDIQDNGQGIDLEANREKLMGLFKRVTNDGSGSGIGMYIINKLLDNYGGELRVDSELGVGSTFSVLLPQYKP